MIAELVNREFCELLVNDTTLLFAGERTAFESQALDDEPVAVDRELRRAVEQHLPGRLGPQRDRLACIPVAGERDVLIRPRAVGHHQNVAGLGGLHRGRDLRRGRN